MRGIDKKNAGSYRCQPVMISGSTHVPPQPYLLEKLMEDFMLEFHRMEKEQFHPVIIAAHLHDELVRIHGNSPRSFYLFHAIQGHVFP